MLDKIMNTNRSKLSSKCRQTREAARAACEAELSAEHEERVSGLRKQIGEAEERLRDQKAKSEAQYRETFRTLERALLVDFYAKAAPLVAQWVEQPSRKLAGQLLALVTEFKAREEFELGTTGYGYRVVSATGFAFVDEAIKVYPSAVVHFVNGLNTAHSAKPLEACGSIAKALGTVIEFGAAIESLERAVFAVAALPASDPTDDVRARYGVTRLCSITALEEFERATRAAVHEANVSSSYRTPKLVSTLLDRDVISYEDGTEEVRYRV